MVKSYLLNQALLCKFVYNMILVYACISFLTASVFATPGKEGFDFLKFEEIPDVRPNSHKFYSNQFKFRDDLGFFNALDAGEEKEIKIAADDSLMAVLRNRILNKICSNMVEIKGGSFMMGCTSEQGQDCQLDEKPAFMTNVGSFFLSKYEVTNLEWWTLMNDVNYSYYDSCHPIVGISWDDIQLFLQRLNQLTDKNFRLPTESEWEFAARGGVYSLGTKYSGSNNLNDVGWCNKYRTQRVGLKLPNELGLYDMSGNVLEWCNDEFRSYNLDSSQLNNANYQKEKLRVLRGGCHYFDPSHCRITNRNARPQNRKDECYGFRLACDRI